MIYADDEMEIHKIHAALMEYKLPLTIVTELSENCQRVTTDR